MKAYNGQVEYNLKRIKRSSIDDQLFEAVIQGNFDRVKELVRDGASVKARDSNGATPLHAAAYKDHLEIVRFLVEKGVEIDARQIDNSTPLILAVRNKRGSFGIVKYLVDNHASVNAEDEERWTPLLWAAMEGKFDVARYLIEKGAIVSAIDKDGNTALILAVGNRNFDLTKYLIEKDADVNAKNNVGFTPLILAVGEGDFNITKYLVENWANLNVKDQDGNTPIERATLDHRSDIVEILQQAQLKEALFYAVENGDFNKVKELVDREVDVNIKDKRGSTPLIYATAYAVFFDNLDIAKYLVENRADVNAENNIGITPLQVAAKEGKSDAVKYLVDKGANVNAINKDGDTALILATRKGNLDVVKYLVDNEADIDVKDKDGCTPIYLAVAQGELNVVKYLVDNGADVNARKTGGNTPIERATLDHRSDIVEILQQAQLTEGLFNAIRQGSLEEVQAIITQGANFKAKDKNGKTPLHWAAECNNTTEIVQLLIEKKVKINAKDKGGKIPLHLAAEKGRLEIVKLLVGNNADIKAKDKDGKTPSDLAIEEGHKDIADFLEEAQFKEQELFDAIKQNNIDKVRDLINRGADVKAKNKDGKTSLHWAAEYNDTPEIVQLLIEKGADINAKDKSGKTPLDLANQNDKIKVIEFLVNKSASLNEMLPLHWAVENCSLKVVKLFIDNDSINAKDRDGKTPLHLAAKTGRSEIAELLVDNKADINATDTSSWTPLHETAGKNNATEGQLNVAKLLISKYANINAKNDKSYTPLHLTAQKGNLNIAEFLTNSGNIDIEARSNTGKTPLHVAAEKNKLKIIELLVNKGANVNAKDNYNETPLDLASEEDIKVFLREHGVRHSGQYNSYFTWITAGLVCVRNFLMDGLLAFVSNNIQDDQINHNASSEGQLPYPQGDMEPGDLYLSQVDFNSTVVLLDMVVRKFTGEKYSLPRNESLSHSEALGYALSITQKFEEAVKQAARSSNISMHRLDIDFIKVQKEVTEKIIGGNFDEISGVLRSNIEKACSGREAGCPGKLNPRKFDKFITVFNNELDIALNQSIPQILQKGNSLPSKANYTEKQSFSLEDEKPKNYLEGVSVRGNLTQIKDV
ncbi:MAG: ankyrin repeat domain-containing protein [Wolbachia sp.]